MKTFKSPVASIAAVAAIAFFLSYSGIFSFLELPAYDVLFKLRPAVRSYDDIVIIEISDDTLSNLGRWPLTRDFHTALIHVLNTYGAKQIIFDLLLSEPTAYDRALAARMQEAGNVYLACAYEVAWNKKNNLPLEASSLLSGVADDLKHAAKAAGHINVAVDQDGKIRRVPLYLRYEGSLIPSLALRAACDFAGMDPAKVSFDGNDAILDGNVRIPAGEGSATLVNFPGRWKDSFYHLSYFEVLKSFTDVNQGFAPSVDLSFLKDKICFIGLTAAGTSDLKATPLEPVYPMVGLQASVFDSIVQRRFLRQAAGTYNALIAVVAFLVSLGVCLRLSPLKSLLAVMLIGSGIVIAAVILFIFLGLWIDSVLPLAVIALTYVFVIVYRLLKEAERRKLLEKELTIARSIQKSFLPKSTDISHHADISAYLEPAYFVAGDLYDVVRLNEERIGLLIADVSGKGAAASLIMAQTISLFRIFAAQEQNPSGLLSRLNNELCGRYEMHFVTCLYVIIDTAQRKAFASSAGHGPLLIYKPKENRIDEVALAQGVPLCLTEGFTYREIAVDILPGDVIIVCTDGVFEARNKKDAEFGMENTKKSILAAKSLTAKDVCENLAKTVNEFSKGRRAHDDVTILTAALQE